MVRVIYLRSVPVDARRELLGQTIGGKRWRLRGRVVTDAAMVQLAKQLHGWAEAVYRFGCAFIHLSAYHAYSVQDPFDALETEDRQSIAAYLNYYHGWPLGLRLSVVSLGPYFSRIFEKIAGNLEVELGELRV